MRRPIGVFLTVVGLQACATVAPLPPDGDLSAIVEDARLGRIDGCRDPRWIAWRFEHGEDGVVRLKALRDLAGARADGFDSTAAVDAYVWSEQRARVSGLQEIVRAALAAADPSRWRSALDESEKRVTAWRAEATQVAPSGLAAAAARQAVWRRASTEASKDMTSDRIVEGRIARCLSAPDEARAEADTVRIVSAALDRDHWPADPIDGDGATRAVLSFRGWDLGRAYLKRNMKRLDAAASRGRLPMGGWVYLRNGLEKDATPRAFTARALRDTRLVRAFFASLPPSRSIGEELYRRVRVDQFAIGAESRLIHEYPRSLARTRAKKLLEASTAKITKDNTGRLKILLRDRNWFDDERDGESATLHGWLLVQHADHDREFQRDVLRRMEQPLATGRIARHHYALLWDRVAVGDKRLQRYGTQMGCTNDVRGPEVGLEDPEHVDARRKAMGLGPWKDYVAAFGPCP